MNIKELIDLLEKGETLTVELINNGDIRITIIKYNCNGIKYQQNSLIDLQYIVNCSDCIEMIIVDMLKRLRKQLDED